MVAMTSTKHSVTGTNSMMTCFAPYTSSSSSSSSSPSWSLGLTEVGRGLRSGPREGWTVDTSGGAAVSSCGTMGIKTKRKNVQCTYIIWDHTDGKVLNQMGTFIQDKFQSQFSACVNLIIGFHKVTKEKSLRNSFNNICRNSNFKNSSCMRIMYI